LIEQPDFGRGGSRIDERAAARILTGATTAATARGYGLPPGPADERQRTVGDIVRLLNDGLSRRELRSLNEGLEVLPARR
jgi:hypothetical protein